MIAKPDAVLHEDVLSHEQREWQNHQVGRDGGDRTRQTAHPSNRHVETIPATQHCASEHVNPLAALLRYRFVNDTLVTPDEHMPQTHQASEEILVLGPRAENRVENFRQAL